MITYIFPGQGSQAKGMGEPLFKKFPRLIKEADDILGYSIVTLCTEDPQNQLSQTQYTQPALYLVNALSYLDKITIAHKPDYVAGHSLGEYNALFAAEVFDFSTGLKLVKKRGELMSQAQCGAMAAIIGLEVDKIKSILEQNGLTQVSIANYNSYTQTVISGDNHEIEQAKILCEKAQAKMVIPLKVSGAFHSQLMQPAQNEFTIFLQQFNFATPAIPIIANVLAKPYKTNEITQNLAQQISHPVRWTDTIEYLLAQGVNEFYEIGPGNVLTGLIKRIQTRQ